MAGNEKNLEREFFKLAGEWLDAQLHYPDHPRGAIIIWDMDVRSEMHLILQEIKEMKT